LGKEIEELIIIPAGRLGTIPIEALLTAEVENNSNYESFPYLIKDYRINMQYAATLYEQSIRQNNNDLTDDICLVAPVDFDDYGLPMLPGTATEVDAISSIFKDRSLPSSIYLHSDANEGITKLDNFTGSKYLHFATHGVVNENKPELSQIYLAANQTEDGNLYSGEIYNLQLKADLVTLSACQTGLGKVYKGEGIIGLSRALVYSGANNLIVSLWSVADQSTSQLMVDFYSDLINNGSSYSYGLQQAKLKMIASNDYSAPYYWAPFILIGN
jgi:CHAT domain-containing protein